MPAVLCMLDAGIDLFRQMRLEVGEKTEAKWLIFVYNYSTVCSPATLLCCCFAICSFSCACVNCNRVHVQRLNNGRHLLHKRYIYVIKMPPISPPGTTEVLYHNILGAA